MGILWFGYWLVIILTNAITTGVIAFALVTDFHNPGVALLVPGAAVTSYAAWRLRKIIVRMRVGQAFRVRTLWGYVTMLSIIAVLQAM